MTIRAVLISILMAIAVNVWPAYSVLILHSSRADYAQISVGFLIPFLFLLFANIPFRKRGGGLAPAELIVICCVGMVAVTMQGEWLSGYLLGTVSMPLYFGAPENRWDELLIPNLPNWAYVVDQGAARTFFEGLPTGDAIPWMAWLPLVWWGTLVIAMLTAGISLVSIFRKQWVEHERLAFPVATALLELTGSEDERSSLRSLLHSHLFIVGFVLTFGLLAWNMVGWSVTGWPTLPILRSTNISLGRDFPRIMFVVHPMTIAFGYFTKSDVLFSIWFFHLLAAVQAGLYNRIGFDIGAGDPWGSFHAAIGWQGFGGMIVFVGWGIWVARHHLASVCRQAFSGEKEVDDRYELMSYRTAFWLFFGCSVYAILFLRHLGMMWLPLLVFWFGTAVLYLGLARIIVESGLVFLRGPITAQAFTWHLFGPAVIDAPTAAAIGLTQAFFCDAKTLGLPALAHVPRLGQTIDRAKRRGLAPLVVAGCAVGAVSVILFTLYQAYTGPGAYNFGAISYRDTGGSASENYKVVINHMQKNFATDWKRVGFLGIGGLFTSAMIGLRYLSPRYSIHPIGFAVGAALTMRSSASSIFIVWILKSVVLKIGSLSLYRKAAPLFLGIMVGHMAGIGLGVIVDAIWFPGSGHPLNRW